MFQFPGFALPRLYIHRGVTGSLRLSFLIQKSSDRRLFASFPRLIAGYHVFRRLSMPRHPPCTLSSLTTFIDHRPHPGRMSPYERPIMGQINTRRASNLLITALRPWVLPTPKTSDSRPSIRQKGARRSSGQDRKDQGIHGGFKSMNTQIQAGRSQSIEACTTGGYQWPGLSKPFVEPLFTCQRTSKRQAVSK